MGRGGGGRRGTQHLQRPDDPRVRQGLRRPVAGLIALLRDHGEGSPLPGYRVHNGALSAPCAHPGGLLAATQTTASWVSELSPGGDRHLATGTAAPCTSVFLPIAVDHPLPLGPAPTGVVDGSSWWWRHETVHRRAIADAARWLPRIEVDRSAVEQAVLAGTVDGGEALAVVTALRERWREHLDADPPADTRPPLVRRYWQVRERAAGRAGRSRLR